MKTIHKKSIILSLALSSSLFASTYEYPQLYKDTRIMGMGGANIAVGGQTSSLFYNSAGIADIPKEYGWEVDIFNLNVAISDNFINFTNDMEDANKDGKTDAQKTTDTLEVTEKYLGKNLNISFTNSIVSVGKKFDKTAFAMMPIAGININSKTHRGSGASGIFEINGLAYSGIAFGLSRDIENREVFGYELKNIAIGVGLKAIKYTTINANLSVSELIDDNINDYFEDRYTKDGSSTVGDIGVKAEVFENFTAGISLQNIGSIAKGSSTSKIPMTLGLGIAYKHRFDRTYFNQYQLAFDYIDLLRGYSQDKDFIKRTRLGVSANVFDGWLGTLGMQAGLYEGHGTFGIDLRMSFVKLAYTIYSEEIGAYSGQDKDKRQMFQVSVGW